MTLVDMYGEAAHCDVCNVPTDEGDLQDLDNGDMACPHCFEILGELREILDAPAAVKESS